MGLGFVLGMVLALFGCDAPHEGEAGRASHDVGDVGMVEVCGVAGEGFPDPCERVVNLRDDGEALGVVGLRMVVPSVQGSAGPFVGSERISGAGEVGRWGVVGHGEGGEPGRGPVSGVVVTMGLAGRASAGAQRAGARLATRFVMARPR